MEKERRGSNVSVSMSVRHALTCRLSSMRSVLRADYRRILDGVLLDVSTQLADVAKAGLSSWLAGLISSIPGVADSHSPSITSTMTTDLVVYEGPASVPGRALSKFDPKPALRDAACVGSQRDNQIKLILLAVLLSNFCVSATYLFQQLGQKGKSRRVLRFA